MTSLTPEIDYLLVHHTSDDPLVIEAIVRAYYEPIHRLAYAMLNHPADAEDATQETFIKVSLHLERYRTGTNFRAWLYTIAINICRGMLRKREIRKKWQTLLETLQTQASQAPVEEAILQNEIHHSLKTALAQLPETHRLPLVLRFAHDLPIAEIAQVLNVREGTVHSRLHYGIHKLRNLIGKEIFNSSHLARKPEKLQP